jgi:hypothetical protein
LTPLSRYFARYLPRALVGPALALAYAGMLLGLAVASDDAGREIIYIDVKGR